MEAVIINTYMNITYKSYNVPDTVQSSFIQIMKKIKTNRNLEML